MKKAGSSKVFRYLIPLALVTLLVSVFMPSSPVLAAPVITLTPASGPTGISVSVSGTVFDSYIGDNIHIFFDDAEISNSPFIVPDNGSFSVSFTVPAGTTPGQHGVEVRSETTSTSMLATSYFTVEATTLVLNAYEGNVGASVNITGVGFYASRPVTLYYTNLSQNQIGTETASPAGKFVRQFTIPAGPAGFHDISATNDYGNSAEIQFKVVPELILGLSSAAAGDVINASGTGFASQSAVTIIFGSTAVTIAQADYFGSFEIDFYVPPVKPMTYDVRAQDNFGNIDVIQFTVTAGANLSESIGTTGSELTVNGSGFIAGHTITVYYDDVPITTTVADNNGDFTATFTVPPGGGSHVITVSDGTNTRNYNFSLERDPPTVPVLSLPIDESMTKAEAFFDWEDVVDPSLPVTYNLEIASDINFASVILYKTGIEISQYLLAESEILSASFKDSPYFWRVKSVDGAGNESEYSEHWVFYISVPSSPSLFLPAADTQVEYPIRFSWESSASLSPPIAYTLQMAASPDFTAPLLSKTGLSATEYLITEEEDLQLETDITYYWRVKAIDNASNSGEWSAVGSFVFTSSGGFPIWATVILIVIAFIIAVLLAFRAGRRTAYH
ncbi:MAG: hypothetical protein JW845_00990 [Dehalococcoidales bacterium]|nr:hypothetical protein [Dehalococcoidales bacterium]